MVGEEAAEEAGRAGSRLRKAGERLAAACAGDEASCAEEAARLEAGESSRSAREKMALGGEAIGEVLDEVLAEAWAAAWAEAWAEAWAAPAASAGLATVATDGPISPPCSSVQLSAC